MTALIRSELLALRTLRSTWAVPAVLIALVVVIVTASLADAGSPGLTTPAELREILVATAGILCAVGMALFAATRAAGEYRHNTITHRLLASPSPHSEAHRDSARLRCAGCRDGVAGCSPGHHHRATDGGGQEPGTRATAAARGRHRDLRRGVHAARPCCRRDHSQPTRWWAPCSACSLPSGCSPW